jgi:hypothetical protein
MVGDTPGQVKREKRRILVISSAKKQEISKNYP